MLELAEPEVCAGRSLIRVFAVVVIPCVHRQGPSPFNSKKAIHGAADNGSKIPSPGPKLQIFQYSVQEEAFV